MVNLASGELNIIRVIIAHREGSIASAGKAVTLT